MILVIIIIQTHPKLSSEWFIKMCTGETRLGWRLDTLDWMNMILCLTWDSLFFFSSICVYIVGRLQRKWALGPSESKLLLLSLCPFDFSYCKLKREKMTLWDWYVIPVHHAFYKLHLYYLFTQLWISLWIPQLRPTHSTLYFLLLWETWFVTPEFQIQEQL